MLKTHRKESRRGWVRVEDRDREELDWYIASVAGLGS